MLNTREFSLNQRGDMWNSESAEATGSDASQVQLVDQSAATAKNTAL